MIGRPTRRCSRSAVPAAEQMPQAGTATRAQHDDVGAVVNRRLGDRLRHLTTADLDGRRHASPTAAASFDNRARAC